MKLCMFKGRYSYAALKPNVFKLFKSLRPDCLMIVVARKAKRLMPEHCLFVAISKLSFINENNDLLCKHRTRRGIHCT